MNTKNKNLKNTDKNQEKKPTAKEAAKALPSSTTNNQAPIFFGFV